MPLNRNELISVLFRETDRAQRSKEPLALIHCGICEWNRWLLQSGKGALNEAFLKITERITRLLRCYDSAGQVADGELVLVLLGCNSVNATTMAHRLNDEVFPEALEIGHGQIQFTACFGVAISAGRSPFVVLREAERALQNAIPRGAGTVCCSAAEEPDSETFLFPLFRDDRLHKY